MTFFLSLSMVDTKTRADTECTNSQQNSNNNGINNKRFYLTLFEWFFNLPPWTESEAALRNQETLQRLPPKTSKLSVRTIQKRSFVDECCISLIFIDYRICIFHTRSRNWSISRHYLLHSRMHQANIIQELLARCTQTSSFFYIFKLFLCSSAKKVLSEYFCLIQCLAVSLKLLVSCHSINDFATRLHLFTSNDQIKTTQRWIIYLYFFARCATHLHSPTFFGRTTNNFSLKPNAPVTDSLAKKY